MRCAAVMLSLVAASGCVIDQEHVSTELKQICTESVPLIFTQRQSGGLAASLPIDGVGRTVDAQARASLGHFSLEPTDGATDLGFADTLTIDIVAPSTALPMARIAELTPVGSDVPVNAAGDPSVNLVDYLTAEDLELRATLLGPAPSATLSTVFEGCLDVDGIVVDD